VVKKINSQKKIIKKENIQQSAILIACDHAGFELKAILLKKLSSLGFSAIDLGCNSAEESVDYPDFAKKLAQKIIAKKAKQGILICGSGIGISIAANRFKQVRAALCYNVEAAKLARKHNDANVLCLGARSTSPRLALSILKAFLATEFEGGRHEKRVAKLSK